MGAFEWPSIYNFPPFFTLQPNGETLGKQLEAWCHLVVDYCHAHNQYELTASEAKASVLFYNKAIDRRVSDELLAAIFKALEDRGNAEALDAERQSFRIYWRSVDAWAALIYQYVKEQGAYDVILTVYELHAGDDTAGQEFHGMDLPTMLRALDALEAQGRCTVFKSDDTEGTGVKFYAA